MATGAKEAGSIVLARHGEPALSRKVRLSAADYIVWWATYEETGLAPGQSPPATLVAEAERAVVLYSSTRRRAIETARIIAGDRDIEQHPDLIEAPLPPPHWPGWIRLRPRSWGVIARFWWWWFNHHDGHETRAEAQVRANEMADRLTERAEAGDNVLVVAHGFFNTMVRLALQRRGWKVSENQGWKYWSFARLDRG
ncbi:MAG TPA: histidine phosphatase family protein [Caulobacteraceae bacterium]|nr:histidine phosphatase family protein [Caulobacteraceae bacterium]